MSLHHMNSKLSSLRRRDYSTYFYEGDIPKLRETPEQFCYQAYRGNSYVAEVIPLEMVTTQNIDLSHRTIRIQASKGFFFFFGKSKKSMKKVQRLDENGW